ncbi:MAG: zinc ABC transporter substrate-binding protein [Desulfovibrio sp.]|nr:zinc ABC transporter substrate-binding protein [Desulfovibrio sp.]
MKHIDKFSTLLPLLFICILTTFGESRAAALRIVAGTSLISDIVKDLTAGECELKILIQGSSCPGHDDVKTKDFVFAAKADLVLLHAFQRTIPQFKTMFQSIEKQDHVAFIEEKGSWLIPEHQKTVSRKIAEILVAVAPDRKETIMRQCEARIARIDRINEECRARLASVRGKSVAAAKMQEEFVRWAGFNVLVAYGRAEDMNAAKLADMVRELQGRKLAGVVDNIQSGAEAGLPLAEELGVAHTALSNFPDSDPSVPDYFSLLKSNVDKLAGLQ